MLTHPLRYRMAIALLAIVAAMVALYLHLWKLGLAGELSCTGGGGCMVAQMSSWGWFPGPDVPLLGREGWRGIDVALIGTLGYALIAIVALLGTAPALADRRWVGTALFVLALAGVAFTWRLKYGEWVVLRVFCIWCFESFVTIHLCLLLAWLDRRRTRSAPA